jgi:serine/threonine protein kinase
MVMQYANDGSLKDFLLKNKIKHDWQWKLNIFRYLAQDLSMIHNAGLIHCDIKDENVYINDNWAYLDQLYWSSSKEELGEEIEFIKGKANDIYKFGILMIKIATENQKVNFRENIKNSDIPKPVLKLINSCLDKDIKKRPDIVKILYILEKWCGNPQHHQFYGFF